MAGMEITTNIGCKVACTYCPQGRIIKAYKERGGALTMSFDTFKACVDKIPRSVIIHFSGLCEGWLNPECTRMVLYAQKTGHKVGVFTTLTGMNLSDVNLLEPLPFLYFCVHLPCDKGYENIDVNENYLKVLEKISKSKINASYIALESSPHPKVKLLLKDKHIAYRPAHTRAGNIKSGGKPAPEKRHGVIGCSLRLRSNVLLPNGDVILCCMDYGMRHVLGNLLSGDYNSLFKGKEFLTLKKGLTDESLDTLCRYCDEREYAYKANLFTRFYLPLKCRLKEFRILKILYRLARRFPGSPSNKKFISY